MKFWEAMKLLEEGKKVRKTSWAENRYLYIDEDGSFYDNREQIPILYTVGTEWEIYDDRKEVSCNIKELYKAIDKCVETSWIDQDVESGFADEFDSVADYHLTQLIIALDELNKKYKLDK